MNGMKVWMVLGALALTGCVAAPTAPSVTAVPGNGKTYAQFQGDDAFCMQAAYSAAQPQSMGVSPYELQHIYDVTFTQCMSAKGNTVSAPPAYAYQGPTVTFGAYPHPFYPAPQPYYYMGGPKEYPLPN